MVDDSGIMRFQWHAISEVKRHCESIKNPTGIESFQIYIDELETYDFKAIENRYKAFFEKYDDIISFASWIRSCWKRSNLLCPSAQPQSRVTNQPTQSTILLNTLCPSSS